MYYHKLRQFSAKITHWSENNQERRGKRNQQSSTVSLTCFIRVDAFLSYKDLRHDLYEVKKVAELSKTVLFNPISQYVL